MLTVTQPVFCQDSSKKVFLSFRIMKKPKWLCKRNLICKYEHWIHYALNRQKRPKENEDKNKPMDDTKENHTGNITKKISFLHVRLSTKVLMF